MRRLHSDHPKNVDPVVDRIIDADDQGYDRDQGAESEYQQNIWGFPHGDFTVPEDETHERVESGVQEQMDHVPAVLVGQKAVADVAFRVEGEEIVRVRAAVCHCDIEVGRDDDGEDKEDRQEQALCLLAKKGAGGSAIEGVRDKVAGDQEEESHEEGRINGHEIAKPHD